MKDGRYYKTGFFVGAIVTYPFTKSPLIWKKRKLIAYKKPIILKKIENEEIKKIKNQSEK